MIALGNRSVLDDKLAVVLNSSQSKTPCGNDPWIRQTALAILQLIASRYSIITSTGLSTWELPIHLVNKCGGKQIIVSPIFDEADGERIFAETIGDFALNCDSTAMIFVKPDDAAKSPKENWLKRDKAVLALAHAIVPISIRPGGRLHGILGDEPFRSRCLDDYKIEFAKPLVGPKHYQLKPFKEFENWSFITHWTKTCHGPWPGETKGSYYARLVSSGDNYPGRAFETLGNIIDEGKIRGSSNWMRDGCQAIGFTEANPSQALGLMRWRSKRVNWNFEPYGVAIDKTIAAQMGIRPVIYGDESSFKSLPDQDKPYFQSLGGPDVDWSREREWRHMGDLNLGEIHGDKVIYLVWEDIEKMVLGKKVSSRVIAIDSP
jgi:hypothetical protein